MALIPSSRYPAQTDTPGATYPHGKARNAGTFQDGTGFPVEKDWINDSLGFHQALLVAAGITPSGDPDEVGASQYLEALLLLSRDESARQHFLFSWAPCFLDDTPPTTLGFGAVYDPALVATLITKGGSNGSYLFSDDLRGDETGITGTATEIQDAAFDPVAGVVVAVGTGGTFIVISSNFGSSWDNATTPLGERDRVVWDAANSLFLASLEGDSNVNTSPTGFVWTARALSGDCSGGLAVLPSGLACATIGEGSALTFDVSSNGTTWADSGGTVPGVASMAADDGRILCSLGSLFYFVGRFDLGNELRVFSSPDGAAWTLVATLTHSTFPVPSPGARILADEYCGALYVLAPTALGSTVVFASFDGGVSWIGPARVNVPADSIRAAGGRLWANLDEIFRCTLPRLPEV